MADSGRDAGVRGETSANRVLVVTTDERLRAELADAFPADYEVDMVLDARGALGYLETHRPAVLVVDIQTGSSGGYGLLKDIQQDSRIAAVPAVMVLERSQDKWLAKQAGAELILTKPVSAERVVADALSLVAA